MTRGTSIYEDPSSVSGNPFEHDHPTVAKADKYRVVKDEILQDPGVKWNFLDVVETDDFLRPRGRTRPQPQLYECNWARRVIDEDDCDEREDKPSVPKRKVRKSSCANTHNSSEKGNHQNSAAQTPSTQVADTPDNDGEGDDSKKPVQSSRARKRTVASTHNDDQVGGKGDAHAQKIAPGQQQAISTHIDGHQGGETDLHIQTSKAQKRPAHSGSQKGKTSKPPTQSQQARKAQSTKKYVDKPPTQNQKALKAPPANTHIDSQVGNGTQASALTPLLKGRQDANSRKITQGVPAASGSAAEPGEPYERANQVRQTSQAFYVPSLNPVPVPDPLMNRGNASHIVHPFGQLSEVPKPASGPLPDPSIQISQVTKRQRQNHTPAQNPQVPDQQGLLASNTSSDSDLPIRANRHRILPLTPTMSSAPPAGFHHHEVIDLEDDSGYGGLEQLTVARANQEPRVNANNTSRSIKAEPLSPEMLARTFLRVSADNMPGKGPVRVPLSLCNSSERLFPVLMAERKLGHNLRTRVSDMTATFTWSKECFGIRKDKTADWNYFSETIRKAWEKDAHRFFEGCYVDVMIHIDEIEEIWYDAFLPTVHHVNGHELTFGEDEDGNYRAPCYRMC